MVEDIILLYILNAALRHANVGSQILDIALCKRVDVNPLVAAQQVVNGLVVDATSILGVHSCSDLQVVELRVGVVDVDDSLLQVVVSALLHVGG